MTPLQFHPTWLLTQQQCPQKHWKSAKKGSIERGSSSSWDLGKPDLQGRGENIVQDLEPALAGIEGVGRDGRERDTEEWAEVGPSGVLKARLLV